MTTRQTIQALFILFTFALFCFVLGFGLGMKYEAENQIRKIEKKIIENRESQSRQILLEVHQATR